jgi:hypothetical protein
MEELKRLAALYYSNTVSLKYFGIKGFIYIFLSIPFAILSIYSSFVIKENFITFIPMLITAALFAQARKAYNKSLIRHLQFFTHSTSNSIHTQKAIYLQAITGHVASTVFQTMKVFKEIIETDNSNRSFVLKNGWHHFFNFLYNSDSKNRIMSLLIYLISLVAILAVVKPDLDYDVYAILDGLYSLITVQNLLICILFVLVGYLIIIFPLMFFITFVIVPLMLKMSSHSFLSKFFISELNKYSFLEKK